MNVDYFLCIHIVTCTFIIEIICTLLDFAKTKLIYLYIYIYTFLKVCCECTWSLIFNDRCTLGNQGEHGQLS